MRDAVALAGLALAAVGCLSPGTPPPPQDRAALIRGILASTVQLRSEHEAGTRRAASGVVVATSQADGRTWIVTTRHFVQPSPPQQVYVRLPGRINMAPATVAFVSPERDLAIIEIEDDGLGISDERVPQALSSGIGLPSKSKRAERTTERTMTSTGPGTGKRTIRAT